MTGRTTYHHGDLRQALVRAALELVAEKGVAGLSVAEAARRVGVSPAAPYRHFADRTALLSAAATALAAELVEHLGSAIGSAHLRSEVAEQDPERAAETLAELTRLRILFTLNRSVGLDLIYADELRSVDDAERRAVTRQLFDLYLWPAMTVTGDAVGAGRLLRQASALAQGYLSLARSGPPDPPAGFAEELADEAAAAVRVLAAAAGPGAA